MIRIRSGHGEYSGIMPIGFYQTPSGDRRTARRGRLGGAQSRTSLFPASADRSGRRNSNDEPKRSARATRCSRPRSLRAGDRRRRRDAATAHQRADARRARGASLPGRHGCPGLPGHPADRSALEGRGPRTRRLGRADAGLFGSRAARLPADTRLCRSGDPDHAFGDAETHAQARDLGAALLLDEPFEMDELRRAVRGAVRH